MKKFIMMFFVAIAAISCGKDDAPVAETTDPKPLKVINKNTGAEIMDGDVLTFTTKVDPTNKLKFYFKNKSNAAKNIGIKIVSVSGYPDISGLSFCYGMNENAGNCPFDLTVGEILPRKSDPFLITVPANGETGNGFNYVSNSVSPIGATKIDYVFEVSEYNGNDEAVGNKVTFTYRYQP